MAALVLGSCCLPFLHFSHPAWGRSVSRTYFILGLAEITVAGLGDVCSRANSQLLASQLASSSPNAIAKLGRSCRGTGLQRAPHCQTLMEGQCRGPLLKAALCPQGHAAILARHTIPCLMHPCLPVLSSSSKAFLALVVSSNE